MSEEHTREELSKTYIHKELEASIYDFWEKEGYFRPEKQRELGLITETSPRFCLTMPPPNVTGVLHLGHAIVLSIEDMMIRIERMLQKDTLYLPGTDHAGIATQSVVERSLRKKGSSRKEIGREKFVEKVWEWKKEYHTRILEQTKRIGVSCDWNRERFTMDATLSRAVRTAFVHLFKKGLIYRGSYMVNWCPGMCESAISDLEAIPEEEISSLWYLKYPIITQKWAGPTTKWGSGKWAEGATDFIIVATTRPETLLGDAAVAVALKHPKFKKYLGKKAALPGTNREIPVIEDAYVDPEFGTGALKITPGHDINDYQIGFTHKLEFITVIDTKGKMVPEYTGKYAGMDRFACRDEIVKDLQKEGLLEKIEPYTHSVAHCERCHTVIEPRISTQWFVRTQRLADAVIDVVQSGQTRIIPPREEEHYFGWLRNIKDWCISRQLWWGHRIPVWYCPNGHEVCEMEDPVKCPTCGSTELKQDEDVLDTWFSSGLWPFSTLGWPNTEHPDYKRYYPTDMRETGYDILFFWVAREMMLGLELTKQTPYTTVYLHGLIRTEKGEKVSKSMENVQEYDPMNIINKWGADSLRFTLLSNAIPARDLNLNPKNVEGAHRFCNKIWQSTKYVLGHIRPGIKIAKITPKYPKTKLKQTDKWILSRLNRLIKTTTEKYQNYDFSNMVREIYSFYWDEFCDWYIESSKTRLYDEQEKDKATPLAVLLYILENCYRLLHPITPFITEYLWQRLPDEIREGPALIISKWPQSMEIFLNDEIEQNYDLIIRIIRGVRSICKDFNITPGMKVPLSIGSSTKLKVIENAKLDIISMASVDPEKFTINSEVTPPKHAGRLIMTDVMVYVPLEGLINMDVERDRVQKQITENENLIVKIRGKLAGEFSKRAPVDVVDQERQKLQEYESKAAQLKDQLEILK